MPRHVAELWDSVEEIPELIKEGSGSIEIPAVAHGIPGVTPPAVVTENGEGDSVIVDADDLLPAYVALSPVQASLIAHSHALHLATVGAESWRWQFEAFSCECWRHLRAEGGFPGGDCKGCAAGGTRG